MEPKSPRTLPPCESAAETSPVVTDVPAKPVGDPAAAGQENARLLASAAAGDREAWEQLVDRYVALIWSITRDFRLSESDAADVTQTTWLRLLEHIDRIHAPERLVSWLATTARRECARVLAVRVRVVLAFEQSGLEDVSPDQPDVDASVLADERAQQVRAALQTLPPRWQRLVALLMADPQPSYSEIADTLGIPIGSIGPTRGRCMQRLRVLLDP